MKHDTAAEKNDNYTLIILNTVFNYQLSDVDGTYRQFEQVYNIFLVCHILHYFSHFSHWKWKIWRKKKCFVKDANSFLVKEPLKSV